MKKSVFLRWKANDFNKLLFIMILKIILNLFLRLNNFVLFQYVFMMKTNIMWLFDTVLFICLIFLSIAYNYKSVLHSYRILNFESCGAKKIHFTQSINSLNIPSIFWYWCVKNIFFLILLKKLKQIVRAPFKYKV